MTKRFVLATVIGVLAALSSSHAAENSEAGRFADGNEALRQYVFNTIPSLTGQGDAASLPVLMPRATVQSWLPEGLTLVDLAGIPAGMQPVLFIFQLQNNVGFAARPDLAHDMDYNEAAVLVMGVVFENDSKPVPTMYNYMPQLFLDKVPPIHVGWYLGFNKALARMQGDHNRFTVESLARRPIMSARLTDDSPPGTIADFPLLATLASSLSPGYIGYNRELGFVCSEQDWHLDVTAVQSVAMSVRVAKEFLPGIGPAEYSATGVVSNPFGGFRLTGNWTFTAPHACNQ